MLNGRLEYLFCDSAIYARNQETSLLLHNFTEDKSVWIILKIICLDHTKKPIPLSTNKEMFDRVSPEWSTLDRDKINEYRTGELILNLWNGIRFSHSFIL